MCVYMVSFNIDQWPFSDMKCFHLLFTVQKTQSDFISESVLTKQEVKLLCVTVLYCTVLSPYLSAVDSLQLTGSTAVFLHCQDAGIVITQAAFSLLLLQHQCCLGCRDQPAGSPVVVLLFLSTYWLNTACVSCHILKNGLCLVCSPFIRYA